MVESIVVSLQLLYRLFGAGAGAAACSDRTVHSKATPKGGLAERRLQISTVFSTKEVIIVVSMYGKIRLRIAVELLSAFSFLF